jgi:hypothetical protein
MKVVGFCGFKQNIGLKSESLNRKIGIRIGNFKGRILTPSLPSNFLEKSDDHRKLLIQPKSVISFNDNLEWGRPFSWPTGDSEIFKLMLEININDDNFNDETNKQLIDSTEDWINRLQQNLFAFDYLLEDKVIKIISSGTLAFEYYFKSDSDKTERIQSNRKNVAHLKNLNNSIDFITLKKVLNATSQNKSLCLEYHLIKNSMIALQNQEYRTSILESATALELCFSNLLKRKLKVNNEKLKMQILKMNNSINKKIILLKTIDVELPPKKFQSDVIDIRNSTIHSGTDVSESEAENAYEIVKSTLDILIKNKFV